MVVFGWVALIILAAFGVLVFTLLVTPFILSHIRTFALKVEREITDRKADIEKKSEERQHRDDIKRQKLFELKNKKLDVKLQKVDKQIQIQNQKLKIAKQLREETKQYKDELNANQSIVEEKVVEETNTEEKSVE